MEPFRGQNGTQMEHVPGRRCRREAGGRQTANVLFGVHVSILAHSFAEGKGWGDRSARRRGVTAPGAVRVRGKLASPTWTVGASTIEVKAPSPPVTIGPPTPHLPKPTVESEGWFPLLIPKIKPKRRGILILSALQCKIFLPTVSGRSLWTSKRS